MRSYTYFTETPSDVFLKYIFFNKCPDIADILFKGLRPNSNSLSWFLYHFYCGSPYHGSPYRRGSFPSRCLRIPPIEPRRRTGAQRACANQRPDWKRARKLWIIYQYKAKPKLKPNLLDPVTITSRSTEYDAYARNLIYAFFFFFFFFFFYLFQTLWSI